MAARNPFRPHCPKQEEGLERTKEREKGPKEEVKRGRDVGELKDKIREGKTKRKRRDKRRDKRIITITMRMARRERKERVGEEWKKVLGPAPLTSSRQDEAKRQSDKTKPKTKPKPKPKQRAPKPSLLPLNIPISMCPTQRATLNQNLSSCSGHFFSIHHRL